MIGSDRREHPTTPIAGLFGLRIHILYFLRSLTLPTAMRTAPCGETPKIETFEWVKCSLQDDFLSPGRPHASVKLLRERASSGQYGQADGCWG